MTDGGQNSGVAVKAVLIDPATMTVAWMNESAAKDAVDPEKDSVPGTPLERAVPATQMAGVLDAVRVAAETGEPQHVRYDLVSMSRGSITVATSVYRLPDDLVLMLSEYAWQAEQGRGNPGARPSRRAGRGRR